MADPSADEWSRRLTSRDVAVRREAARQLLRAGEAAGVAAAGLVRAVADEDEQVALDAVAALEGMGAPPPAAHASLLEFLTHPHADCGYWAATLVGRLGPAGAPAVAALADALQHHPALAVRERAAWALGQIGPAAAPAREVLAAAAAAPTPRLARLAATALDQLHS